MSTTTISNMKVYDELLVGSYYERIAQNINAFNAASAGTMLMTSGFKQGDYEKESFFKNFTALSRRDDTSTSSASATNLVQDEDIRVKLKRKFLVETTQDAFRSMGYSMETFAQLCGEQLADETKQEALERVIAALDAALGNVSAVNLDVSGDGSNKTISHINVNRVFAKLGDKSSNIKALVMNGAAFHDWAGGMLGGTAPQFNDSGISVYNGGVPTLGRPVIVTDSLTLGPTNKYVILGLQAGAATINISEDPITVFDDITGNENLIKRCQSEGAYNIGLKGFKWDTQNGGRNPANSAVATASNWDQTATSHKDLPGVRLVVATA